MPKRVPGYGLCVKRVCGHLLERLHRQAILCLFLEAQEQVGLFAEIVQAEQLTQNETNLLVSHFTIYKINKVSHMTV